MNSISNILPKVRLDFPHLRFEPGDTFRWTPKQNLITYTSHQDNAEHGVWALLHEIAHAELGHVSYKGDFDLLQLEVTAWHHAHKLAKKYGISIDKEHVQDCLDTYRDWLHTRASCPVCNVVSLQRSDGLYQCFNCRSRWRVPRSPLCRVSRTQMA